jgi:transcriptional regulator with XRE-family HTH domain
VVKESKLDVASLYAALSAKRRAQELSWRQVAQEIGISPSTLTRLANGQRPDVDAFITLIKWLGVPAEQFMVGSGDSKPDSGNPDILSQLLPLLHARTDLALKNREYLEEIIRAAVRHMEKPD